MMNENSTVLPAFKQEPDIQERTVIMHELEIQLEPEIKQEPEIRPEPDIKQELEIGQEPDIKQEPKIKQEPDFKEDSVEHDNRVPLKRKGKEILMEFSRSRKKIIYLYGSNTLFGEYNKLLYSDPSLSDLLLSAYPIFQEFNPRFKTWVDIDHEENLRDGAVVKVRFFLKAAESDGSYPGSSKRKRDDFDSEPNPKQRRTQKDSFENDSYSQIKSPERNDVENVDPERKSNVLSPGIRKCQTGRKPRSYYRNSISVRKNIFPRFRSNSLDRWGSEEKPVPPSPGSEKKQWFLRPEENPTITHVTSTNVEPQNFAEMGAADLHPDSHLPSYAVDQTTQAVLSERQTVTPSRIQPLFVEENQHANSPHGRCSVNVTPSRIQTLLVENQHASSPQSSCSIGNLIGKEFMTTGPTSTPAKIHPLVFDEKQPANSPQKPAPLPRISERTVAWNVCIPTGMKHKRLLWGLKNLEKIWWNTVFSDVAMFSLKGNYIKYHEHVNFSKKDSEIFWGFRSFDGPNILAHLGISLTGLKLAEVLRNKIVKSLKVHYKGCDITLQILGSLKTQFDSKCVRDALKKNSIVLSEWPSCARDLSPISHAWKLVAEKVKNIPCSSKQEMLSVVSGVWEKDVDVQLMCSKVITLLPQVIKSVVEQNGSYPRVKVRYVMTT